MLVLCVHQPIKLINLATLSQLTAITMFEAIEEETEAAASVVFTVVASAKST